ncbi:MAG: ferritin [Cyclobacteriaceae bacterium]|nr:ferritin [Cyclobacteriaceae bacterium]
MEKQIVTPKRSLTTETEKLLNNQVGKEASSSSAYLSMASWCEKSGYANAAEFLYRHSDEERMHMLKLFRYINDAGGHALQPAIKDIRHEYKSLRDVFEQVLEHEIRVTESINNIVDHCFTIKDFATFQFLQWYVTEQREEETLARRALELFDIIGEDGVGLWTIDQELGKLESFVQDGGAEQA